MVIVGAFNLANSAVEIPKVVTVSTAKPMSMGRVAVFCFTAMLPPTAFEEIVVVPPRLPTRFMVSALRVMVPPVLLTTLVALPVDDGKLKMP
jgi:hypothetical protein